MFVYFCGSLFITKAKKSGDDEVGVVTVAWFILIFSREILFFVFFYFVNKQSCDLLSDLIVVGF